MDHNRLQATGTCFVTGVNPLEIFSPSSIQLEIINFVWILAWNDHFWRQILENLWSVLFMTITCNILLIYGQNRTVCHFLPKCIVDSPGTGCHSGSPTRSNSLPPSQCSLQDLATLNDLPRRLQVFLPLCIHSMGQHLVMLSLPKMSLLIETVGWEQRSAPEMSSRAFGITVLLL